ncbi:hypothetical protein M2266_000562 [Streptomyces sp. SPB162]|nr:hypothetical protein [Streptomyces sp. SPB162]
MVPPYAPQLFPDPIPELFPELMPEMNANESSYVRAWERNRSNAAL